MFRAERKSREIHTYEVFPVNYLMLPPQKRDEVIGSFQRFLNSLSSEVRIWVVKTVEAIPVGKSKFETAYSRFFVESLGEPVDWLLERCGFKYQSIMELPKPNPVKTFSKHMALLGGRLMKTYTVYTLPGTLWPGFLREVYDVAERLSIRVHPLPPGEATMRMGKYMRFMRSLVLADQAKGRLVREEVKLKHDMAAATYQALIAGNTRLFEFTFNISVAGGNREELDENSKKLRETLHSRLIRLDCPAFLQREMVLGSAGKKLVVDTGTASAFFPFVSSNLIESPDGIFIGVNRLSGAPVIFDPWLRMNQNLLVVGKSGSGKSFLSKIILSRLVQKNRNLAFYIIDPENEYAPTGGPLGAEVLDVTVDKQLGLDPIQIFSTSKDTAAGILADITGIDDRKTYQELRTIVGGSRDVLDVYQNSPPSMKDRLEPFINGPDSFLTMGKPQNFTNRMVFNLNALHRQLTPTQQRSITFQAANILLFSKIWQMLDNPQFLPLHIPKLVIVDEVWLYTATPTSASFLEGVSRRGRKRNCMFLLCSVPPDETVVLIDSESLKVTEVGPFIDCLMQRKKSEVVRDENRTEILENHDNIYTLSFDPETLKVTPQKITSFIRHPPTDDLYELKLSTGRSVKVTGSHSVFTLKDLKVVQIPITRLKEGNAVAVVGRFDYHKDVDAINVLKLFIENLRNEELAKLSLVGEGVAEEAMNRHGDLKQAIINAGYKQWWKKVYKIKKYGNINLCILKHLPKDFISNAFLIRTKAKIRVHRAPLKNALNAIVEVSEDLTCLLGLITADGYVAAHASNGQYGVEITCAVNEKSLLEKANDAFKTTLGLEGSMYPDKRENMLRLVVSSKPLALFLKLIGAGIGKEHHVPPMTYGLTRSKIVSFIKGVWEGDGAKRAEAYSGHGFTIYTSDRKLANEYVLLLLRMGQSPSISERMSNPGGLGNSFTHTKKAYSISVPKGNINTLAETRSKRDSLPIVDFFYNEKLKKTCNIRSARHGNWWISKGVLARDLGTLTIPEDHRSKLLALIEGDIRWVRVKSIKKLKTKPLHVYDLGVRPNGRRIENFTGGFGGVCLHNTQRLGDIVESPAGKAVIENCASKILLRQDESAIRLVGETIGLSAAEMDALLEFGPGQGIVITEDIHVPVDFLATKEEYAVFTTRPQERLFMDRGRPL